MAEWTSATGSADENVDISAPDAGVYRVFVDVFSGSTAFNLNTFSVLAGAGAGAFHATPAAVAGVQGVPVGYTLARTGLAPMTEYLGLVTYGDTAMSTAVSVSSGEAPVVAPANTALPTITGKLRVGKTLTATPGAWDTDGLAFSYRWMRNGANISGATNATYRAVSADAGAKLTVRVTASKDGLPSGVATSAAVVVKFTATVKMSLNTQTAHYGQWIKVTASVVTAGPVKATATVKVGSRAYTMAIDSHGDGSITIKSLSRGKYSVSVAYLGNARVAPATSSSLPLTVS